MRGRRPKRGARAAYAASVVIVVAMVLTGCAHSDPHAPRTVAPTDPSDCNALTPIGDGGVLAGFDWSSGDHRIGEAAVVYARFRPQGGTLVITSDSAQVTITPSRVAIPLGTYGVIAIRVTVRAAGTARLQLDLLDNRGAHNSGAGGPRVVATNSSWHFAAGE